MATLTHRLQQLTVPLSSTRRANKPALRVPARRDASRVPPRQRSGLYPLSDKLSPQLNLFQLIILGREHSQELRVG